VIDASSSVELEEFEQIEAAPGRVLLRVALRLRRSSDVGGGPTLLIEAGGRTHRLSALTSPPDPGGLLRAAFSAPPAILERGASFKLELPDGSALELPVPARRSRRAVRASARDPSDRSELAELERRLEELVAELAETRSARMSAEETIARLTSELERRTAEARDIARNFEQEAAARLQAEAEAQRLSEALRAAEDAASPGAP
jgi:hypothetical protein